MVTNSNMEVRGITSYVYPSDVIHFEYSLHCHEAI